MTIAIHNNGGPAVDLLLHDAAASTTSGTIMSVGGLNGVMVQVTGTFSATIIPKIAGAYDDGGSATFVAVPCVNMNSSAVLSASTGITAAGMYWIPLTGADQLKLEITVYASGSVTAYAKGVPGGIQPAELLAYGGTATSLGNVVATGAADEAAAVSGYPVRIAGWNGTNAYTLKVDTSGRLLLAAGELYLGSTGISGDVLNVTPTMDTSAYTANDVWFDTTAITSGLRVSGGRAEIVSVGILDEDDNTAAAVTLFFFRSNVSLGTINNAPSITDANARELQGYVSIASGDWIDLGGSKFACVKNVGLMYEATTGTTMYVAGTCAGTPTQTASGVKLMIGVRWH